MKKLYLCTIIFIESYFPRGRHKISMTINKGKNFTPHDVLKVKEI